MASIKPSDPVASLQGVDKQSLQGVDKQARFRLMGRSERLPAAEGRCALPAPTVDRRAPALFHRVPQRTEMTVP
jgi:hypothetical protein